MTFAELKTATAKIAMPNGYWPELWRHWHHYLEEALNELQTWDKCLQQRIVDIVPACSTMYKCGTSGFEKPDGEILSVDVVSERIVELVPSTPFESGALLAVRQYDMHKAGQATAIPFQTIFFPRKEFQIGIEVNAFHRNPRVYKGTPWQNIRFVGNLYYVDSDSSQNTHYHSLLRRLVRKVPIVLECPIDEKPSLEFILNPKPLTAVYFELTEVTGPLDVEETEYGIIIRIFGPPYSNGSDIKLRQIEWCGMVNYEYVPPRQFSQWYDYVSEQANLTGLRIGAWFGFEPQSAAKAFESLDAVEQPQNEAVIGHAAPMGWYKASSARNSKHGRSLKGVWTIMNNLIVLAPWLQTYENVIVHWRGRKYRWYDRDWLPNWAPLIRACAMYAAFKYYTLNRREITTAQKFMLQYIEARSRLIKDCIDNHLPPDDMSLDGAMSSVYGADRSSLFDKDKVKIAVTIGGIQAGEVTTDDGVGAYVKPPIIDDKVDPPPPPPPPPPPIEPPTIIDGDNGGGTEIIVPPPEIKDPNDPNGDDDDDDDDGNGDDDDGTGDGYFKNDRFTYKCTCEDIGCNSPTLDQPVEVTIDVEEGAFTGLTKEDANATARTWARGEAIKQLAGKCLCDVTNLYCNAQQTIIVLCPYMAARCPSPDGIEYLGDTVKNIDIPENQYCAASHFEADKLALLAGRRQAIASLNCMYWSDEMYAEIFHVDNRENKVRVEVPFRKYVAKLDLSDVANPNDWELLWRKGYNLRRELQRRAANDLVQLIRQAQNNAGWPNNKLAGTIFITDERIIFSGGLFNVPCLDDSLPFSTSPVLTNHDGAVLFAASDYPEGNCSPYSGYTAHDGRTPVAIQVVEFDATVADEEDPARSKLATPEGAVECWFTYEHFLRTFYVKYVDVSTIVPDIFGIRGPEEIAKWAENWKEHTMREAGYTPGTISRCAFTYYPSNPPYSIHGLFDMVYRGLYLAIGTIDRTGPITPQTLPAFMDSMANEFIAGRLSEAITIPPRPPRLLLPNWREGVPDLFKPMLRYRGVTI